MDSFPLAISRQFPGMEKRYLDAIKKEVSKVMNRAAMLADDIPDLSKAYINENQS